MDTRSVNPGFKPVRRDQLRQERVHDTYKLPHKLSEPSVCSECGVVYHAGRWQWGKTEEPPAHAHAVVCAACQRVKDHFPAGFVECGGSFFAEHREELMSLLQHHESREKANHPLARIMAVEASADGVLVTTTDMHLARDLGEALHHAYQGELEYHYNEGENLLRVRWHR